MTVVGAGYVAIAMAMIVCLFVLGRSRPAAPRRPTRGQPSPGRSNKPSVKWSLLAFGMSVALAVGSPGMAVALPLVAGFAQRELTRRSARSLDQRRAEMAVGFVALTTSGLRAGTSLANAVLDGERGQSVNDLQTQVAARVDGGRAFAVAVDEVLGSGSFDERLIATTIRALEATGASAGEALERVAEALGERQSSREDARTQAQHALSSAGVLAALPLVFGTAAALAEPEVGALYASSWLGAMCIGTALLCIFGGWEWLQRLLVGGR